MEDSLWHAMGLDEVLGALGSGREGLSDEGVSRRRAEHGENRLAERRRVSWVNVFFGQFQNFMVIVLLIATLISGLLGEFTDAVTIIVIVLANALLGFFQQVRAESSLSALRELTAPAARVRRAGEWREIPAADLVPGDVISISEGDRAPADARLLESAGLEMEESSLTGEHAPATKDAAGAADPGAPLGDRTNMLYMGTMATRGKGVAVVVATGMDTEMGRIAELIQTREDPTTPLEHRLDELGRVLVYISIAITLAVVVAGIVHGHAPYEMFLAGVSLAVAAIPEGLPATVTIALAIGVQRMIRRNAIVRKLPSVETLGCATVICSDKTGTLTQNKMAVREVYVSGILVQTDQIKAFLRENPRMGSAFGRAVEIAVTCNNARQVDSPEGSRTVGDPTETALLHFADQSTDHGGGGQEAERVSEFPFDSDRKRMSVVVRRAGGLEVHVKGAPDLLLRDCSRILDQGVEEPLTEERRRLVEEAVGKMAGKALRTLGLAYRRAGEMPRDALEAESGLVFAGAVGLADPPRPEVKESIALCRRAGIRTVMITGDHRLTAEAVARELGILTRRGTVMTGAELDRMDDRALEDQAGSVCVFARVSPAHKLRIVEALQKNGHVVAMTGDGVNDAPAIKAADIGISMGRSGTDVAKEASSLVLADDNFATIVSAVEEGRGIYDNIRKFIRYLLTSNVGEIVTMFLAMAGGLPLPLLPIQILWVNLVTDGLPAIALGVDSVEEDIMLRPPRDVREGIFARGLGGKILFRGLLIGLVTLAVFYGALSVARTGLAQAQTMAFATLVLAQLIHVFDCRSADRGLLDRSPFGNRWLLLAVLSSFSLLMAAIYAPSLRAVFRTVPPSPAGWAFICAAAVVPTAAAQLGSLRSRAGAVRASLR